jgi:hypothetical protein
MIRFNPIYGQLEIFISAVRQASESFDEFFFTG